MNTARERFDETVGGDRVGERRKSWEAAKSEIDFGDRAIGAYVTNAQSERWVELRGIDEFEKSALGIDARNDRFDSDFFVIGENEAGDGSILYANMLNSGVGTDFGASGASRFSESACERAETSARKRSRTRGIGIDGSAKKKDSRGTGGPRT